MHSILTGTPGTVWDTLTLGQQAELRHLIGKTLHMPWIRYLEERFPGFWNHLEEEMILSHNYRWYLNHYDVSQSVITELVKYSRHIPLIYVQWLTEWTGPVHYSLACATGDPKAVEMAIPYIRSGCPVWNYTGPDPQAFYDLLVEGGITVHQMPWLFEVDEMHIHLREYSGPVDGHTDLAGYLVNCHRRGWEPCQSAVEYVSVETVWSAFWNHYSNPSLDCVRSFCQWEVYQSLCGGEEIGLGDYRIYLTAWHSNWVSTLDGEKKWTGKNQRICLELEKHAGEECHYDGCIISASPKLNLETVYRYRGYTVGVGLYYRSDSTVHERAIDRLISGFQPSLME